MNVASPLLTTAEAAEYLRTPVSTLAYWRAISAGPIYSKVGTRCLYRLPDLEAFVSSCAAK